MRLLNTKTFKLSYFVDSQVPPYVILSHTWGQDEVLFDDICQETAATKPSFRKLEGCCNKAAADGFQWVWIDTCCIDKSSSAELSEAINSMYQWYKAAVICFVYLEDISFHKQAIKSKLLPLERLAESRWFTRGWTLQELIAPPILELYTTEWIEIGTKASLSGFLSDITGIPIPILRGEDPSTCSVAQRMLWASKRQTTREEDTAYCLLGLFGVNMPMLYGEGLKAFQRLQEGIMQKTEDHTIFAWSLRYDCSPSLTGVLASCPADFSQSIPINLQQPWQDPKEYSWRLPNYGAIKEPDQRYEIPYDKGYERLAAVDPLSVNQKYMAKDPPQLTSRGLRISLPLRFSEDSVTPTMAWIYCILDDRLVCIFVDKIQSSTNLFARDRSSWLVTVSSDQLKEFHLTEIYLHLCGVIGSAHNFPNEMNELWGRIKVVPGAGERDHRIIPLYVYPIQHWNLDELFYKGKPSVFGVILFEMASRGNKTQVCVVLGQHNNAPWCEVHNIPKGAHEFKSKEILEELYTQASQTTSHIKFSDRSSYPVGYNMVFSVAIRQCPSSNSLASIYTLRTSFGSLNENNPWESMLLSRRN